MARSGTRADATWHTKPRGSATWTHALMWRGRAVGPRESTRTPGWSLHSMSDGLAGDRPTGIVGSG